MLTYICNSCGKKISKLEGIFVTLEKGLVEEEYILCHECAEALKKDLKNKEE